MEELTIKEKCTLNNLIAKELTRLSGDFKLDREWKKRRVKNLERIQGKVGK